MVDARWNLHNFGKLIYFTMTLSIAELNKTHYEPMRERAKYHLDRAEACMEKAKSLYAAGDHREAAIAIRDADFIMIFDVAVCLRRYFELKKIYD